MNKHPKIRLFNVKFSPNLGDGLLSECLEKALIENGADPDTWSIDLAARKEYGDVLAGRALIMSVLESLPGPLRAQFVQLPVALKARSSWRPHYAERLDGADAVVIGGGNLISDIDLNFPTKLTLAVEEAEKRSLPTVIYASGVAGGWSAKGTAMFKRAFSRDVLKAVLLRDADSKTLWDEALGAATGHEAIVVRDPGLLASAYYPAAPRPARDRPVAGLGLMSPIAIHYHSTSSVTKPMLDRWYVETAKGLVAAGFSVAAFTNGSPEDKSYAEALRPALEALGSEVSFPTQRTPAELCAIIAGFDVLVGYRMHAIIAAYSYGVPAIALAWDRKLKSFMRSVGRERFFGDVTNVTPAECVRLAQEAVRDGIPEAERREVLEETRDGVRRLYAILTGAGAGSGAETRARGDAVAGAASARR